ncbi:MAG: hypothetical protein Q8N63_04635 [Nanoarchaeota archaeon]|nr:hypothetical protein [Nanoarchaeota archaeon]
MIQNLLYLLLLLTGFPAGLILAKLCKEEIKKWRKRLFVICFVSLILAVITSFIPFSLFLYKLPVIISLFFIIITFLTIVWKSY